MFLSLSNLKFASSPHPDTKHPLFISSSAVICSAPVGALCTQGRPGSLPFLTPPQRVNRGCLPRKMQACLGALHLGSHQQIPKILLVKIKHNSPQIDVGVAFFLSSIYSVGLRVPGPVIQHIQCSLRAVSLLLPGSRRPHGPAPWQLGRAPVLILVNERK